MEYAMKLRLAARTLAALAFSSLSILLATTNAFASDELTKILNGAHSAISAEVFIVPKSVLTPTNLVKAQLPIYGCGYAVPKNQVAELMAIVDQAAITKRSIEREHLNMRLLVRLHMTSGAPVELAFESRPSMYSEKKETFGQVNGLDATAAPDIFENLHRWISNAALTSTKEKSTSCP